MVYKHFSGLILDSRAPKIHISSESKFRHGLHSLSAYSRQLLQHVALPPVSVIHILLPRSSEARIV